MAQKFIREESNLSAPTRFVVVDDDEEILQIWRRLLETEKDCICTLTDDPLAALREIETQGADVLITDLVMPTLSGFQLAKLARALSPDLQVFFTTGSVALLEEMSDYPQTQQRIYSLLKSKEQEHGGDLSRADSFSNLLDVLQKPYADLHNVQSFIHELATHQPLDVSHCTEKGNLRLWNL
jgi:CheY-like chemotaxis protein